MAILVVDDSSSIRKIITGNLLKMGFTQDEIILAVDGVDALRQLKSHNIHLILTDWNMPNMNGYDFVVKTRDITAHKNTPIVMVTTEGGKKEVLSALKIGVNSYVVKPFSKEILEDKIEKLIDLPDLANK